MAKLFVWELNEQISVSNIVDIVTNLNDYLD
jgi:hypothetical protein